MSRLRQTVPGIRALHLLSFIAPRASLVGRVVCVPMLLAAMGAAVSGQVPSSTFDGLVGKIQPGDRVYLTEATGKEQQATIRSLTSDLLQVEIEGARRDLQPSGVRRIRVTRRDSLWNGIAIGAGIGAALGVFSSGAGECTPSPGCVVSGTLATAGMGAVIGWLVDRGAQRRVVVYEARKSSARR